MRLSAVILAGGQSKRMGRDKAWVRFRGKSMIQTAVDNLRAAGVEEVFISARMDQDFSALNCRVLLDLEPGLGPISGIERGLRESTAPLVLVLPVDLPGMTPACLGKLLHACNDLTGAVASIDGELQPLVAVYPRRCHTYAVLNIARGDYAVHQFASACLHERAIRLFRVQARDAGCFKNCNDPAALTQLESELHVDGKA